MKKFLFPLLLALCGCASMFESSQTHTLSQKDSTVSVNVGDTIVIKLESNPTTGYQWTPVEYNYLVLKIKGRNFTPSSNLAGTGGISEISFEAVADGESDIKLAYMRPWEKKPANEANFEVTVTP
jgi:Predicted secreted protein